MKKNKYPIHFAETPYGFDYGSAKITRLHSEPKTGGVVISIDTPRQEMQVCATRTGKLRVFVYNKSKKVTKEWVPKEE